MPRRQGRHVEEEQVLDVAREHARLDGGAHRHHLVGVHALVGLLAEVVLDELLDLGDAGGASHQHDLVDLAWVRPPRPSGTGAPDPWSSPAGPTMSCSSFARVSFRARCLGPLASAVTKGRLISVSRVVQSSHLAFSAASLSRWRAILSLPRSMPWSFLNSCDDPLDDPLVEVVAAEVGVAVRGLDLDHSFSYLEDGDVEGAAAEVVDGDGLVLLLVEAVGEGGGGGLVDDAEHLEAGDLARVLRGLALRVVEVGGNGDDRLRHLLAEVLLGGVLHLLQDDGGDLGGRDRACRRSRPGRRRCRPRRPCRAPSSALR